MIAVISDVHSNLEALKAVLKEIKDADAIYCAGDLVGYGPNPNECCDLIRELGIKCVQGNHDYVCANYDRIENAEDGWSEEDRALCQKIYDQKNSAAKAASRWTNSVLTDENKQFIRQLPLEISEHGFTMVHGKPGSKESMLNEYVMPGAVRSGLSGEWEGAVLIVGHSHIPMRTANVVNPGSVGQPRDRNWRASFATFTDAWYRFTYINDEDMSFRIVSQIVRVRRVDYDVRRTIRKIKAQPEIPDTLGDRLTVGL